MDCALLTIDNSELLPPNYRPVALTSHLIKILEKNFAKNIHQFHETRHKMNPQQVASDPPDPAFPSFSSITT